LPAQSSRTAAAINREGAENGDNQSGQAGTMQAACT